MLAIAVFILFVVLLLLSVPISSTLSIVSLAPSILDPNFTISPEYIIRAMFGGIDSFPLLAVPMFVLSGILMAKGGVSKKLFDVFSFFIGKRTSGMPCAAIITCLFYGAISGSAPATVAAVGSMTIPLLVKLGYDKTFVTAIVAVAGGLGVIIPPSIPFILYGMASGTSVGRMFMAGIVPGLLIAALLMIYAFYYCKKHGEDKDKIDAEVNALHDKGFKKVFFDSFWALLTPVIILGCIYSGVASPTEAAVISVFYALFLSLFIYKSLHVKDLYDVFVESIKTFAPILFILASAVCIFKNYYTTSNSGYSGKLYFEYNSWKSSCIDCNQYLVVDCRYGNGYKPRYLDFDTNPTSNCSKCWCRFGTLWNRYGCELSHWLCDTTNWNQFICS